MHKALLLLRKIPKGKVCTYGELARAFNNTAGARNASLRTSPRAIGQVMRTNPLPEKWPCYKVINSDGSLGGYGGETEGKKIEEKIKLLKKDGIIIKNNRIDKKYLFKFRQKYG